MPEYVEMRCAYQWTCPDCGREQFEAAEHPELTDEELAELRTEHDVEPWETGQFVTCPKRVTCRGCGALHPTAPFCPDADEEFKQTPEPPPPPPIQLLREDQDPDRLRARPWPPGRRPPRGVLYAFLGFGTLVVLQGLLLIYLGAVRNPDAGALRFLLLATLMFCLGAAFVLGWQVVGDWPEGEP